MPARPAWLTNARLIDLAFLGAVTVAALVLRIWHLSRLPYGLHGDEAFTGLDARRILSGDQIFPYTSSALGQPAGPMYLAAASVKLLGSTIVALRLPMALLGVATVILAFFAFRELFGRATAWAGAILLAFSSWLIFYNRTGFSVSAMPFTEMAALLSVAIALRKRTWPWFVLAGAVVGLGIYGYFSYPLFAAGLACWILVYTVIERPRPFWPHIRNGAVMALTALLVVQPMWPYLNDANRGYAHDRVLFSLSSTPAYKSEDTLGRVRLYWDNTKRVVNALREGGHGDATDGSGEIAALDPLMIAMALAGTALCTLLATRRRRAAYLLPLIIVPVVLIGPILSSGGPHRRSLGILPFVALPAAVLLGSAWEWLMQRDRRAIAMGVAGVPLLIYAAINVDGYFRQTPDTPAMLYTFAPELANAVSLIRKQPADTHVYLVSERWSANYETVQYLLPDRHIGDGLLEDRSTQYGKVAGYDDIDRTRPSLIVLLNSYVNDADALAAKYPDATKLVGQTVNKRPSYIAFAIAPAQ